ncbi:response regulator [Parabacteroides merdae]|jgi:two-component system aerobic respiration control sensor histidine kinase ArcB|uniref:histidine kinase n=1 Tax=Parabacteroides merdae TaxID=46503 RepID=A0A414Y2Z3_9BACT|nr:hybrid sensor histidine kinase/response regulator [Parabacteroides merdae]RGZ49359.1 response regulator [Parabacteroides merdae]RHH80568.1 response regulator [Parabacteroides merdae]
MKLLLQHRILFGYIILMAVIGSMAAIMFHERIRVHRIEKEISDIREANRTIIAAHRFITVLATLGESAITWDKEDYYRYQKHRLRADSLLQILQQNYERFVPTMQIDTLRILLANKETHLYKFMGLFQQQDSLLLKHLPTITQQARNFHTITRKKKGIAGFFGAKETVQIPISSKTVHSLNEQLISMEEERQQTINAYTDSLRIQNRKLNRKLSMLIKNLDEQTQAKFQDKELHINESYERSILIVTLLIISAIILLIISYLIIQRDIRQKEKTRKRMEETIKQNASLLDMRKNIILTISHDIRAPLNVIGGSAELAMDTRDKKQRNNHLNNIRIVCKHITHLLNNLLDVYRLNEAKETRNDVPFSLNDLLERTVSGFTHIVNNKGILFNHRFDNTDVKLLGDMDRIGQIIDNLLTNAVKFTESGTISFNARYDDGRLSLEVKDTGIGMDEIMLSRIFQPFERLASETNTDGFGLGLPITKGLVDLLGGTITVASEAGSGSTFWVTLPLPVTNELIEDENTISSYTGSLPQDILVIDDDPMLLNIVKEMLERNGVTCTICTTAKDVVKAMRNQNYDLLLSDIQMPGTNGFELLALLRNSNIGNSRTIPVVAMTARGDRDKEAFLNTGFTDCIYKPFSSSELLSLISGIKKQQTDDGRHSVDFNTMLSEVSDGVKQLRSFIAQSEKDREELESAMKKSDRMKMRETAHRMQPSWDLLHTGDRLMAYRTLLKDGAQDDTVVKEHTKQIIDYISTLIAEAEDEIKRQINETENTDS